MFKLLPLRRNLTNNVKVALRRQQAHEESEVRDFQIILKNFDKQQSANFADSSKQLPLNTNNLPASSLSLYTGKNQPSASGNFVYTRNNNEKLKTCPKNYQNETLSNNFEKIIDESKVHASMLTLLIKKLNKHFLKLYRVK